MTGVGVNFWAFCNWVRIGFDWVRFGHISLCLFIVSLCYNLSKVNYEFLKLRSFCIKGGQVQSLVLLLGDQKGSFGESAGAAEIRGWFCTGYALFCARTMKGGRGPFRLRSPL